jgi:Ni,Fe-hydrogenase III small subunit
MLRFWGKRVRDTIKTENLEFDKELEQIKEEIKDNIKKRFAGSLAVRMVDSGSCNACEAECNSLSNPYYNLERLGIYFVASPRHADVLLVSGVNTFNMQHHLIEVYEQLPSPKWVITLGDCPLNLSSFDKTFAIKGEVEKILPVTHHIEGCPPEPAYIIKGFLEFLKKI